MSLEVAAPMVAGLTDLRSLKNRLRAPRVGLSKGMKEPQNSEQTSNDLPTQKTYKRTGYQTIASICQLLNRVSVPFLRDEPAQSIHKPQPRDLCRLVWHCGKEGLEV